MFECVHTVSLNWIISTFWLLCCQLPVFNRISSNFMEGFTNMWMSFDFINYALPVINCSTIIYIHNRWSKLWYGQSWRRESLGILSVIIILKINYIYINYRLLFFFFPPHYLFFQLISSWFNKIVDLFFIKHVLSIILWGTVNSRCNWDQY